MKEVRKWLKKNRTGESRKRIVEEEGKEEREREACDEPKEERDKGSGRHEKKCWRERRESPNRTWRKEGRGLRRQEERE